MRTHILQAMVLLNRCSFKLLLESELFRAFIELSDQRPPPADHCTPTADHDNKRGSGSGESLQSEVKTVAILLKWGSRKMATFVSLVAFLDQIPKVMGGVESIVFIITSLTSHLSPDGTRWKDGGERKSP